MTVTSALLTAAMLVLLPLPWPAQMAMLGWCLLAAATTAYRHYRDVPVLLAVGVDRRVAFTDRHGMTREGDVLDATYVSGFFTSIVWRPDGARRSRAYAIAPDVLDGEERRRLRVWLRYGRTRSAASPDDDPLAARVPRGDVAG